MVDVISDTSIANNTGDNDLDKKLVAINRYKLVFSCLEDSDILIQIIEEAKTL